MESAQEIAERELYTHDQFEKATNKLFEVLKTHYPHGKKEIIGCIDAFGTYPVAHWRPEHKSPICLSIELQDDGGEPYAVVRASHNQPVQSKAEHKGVFLTTEVANIYPEEFDHIPEIIEYLQKTPLGSLKLSLDR
jgi:hypothetical protein